MEHVGEMAPVAQEAVRQDLQAMFRGAIRWPRTVENISMLVAYAVGPDGHRVDQAAHEGSGCVSRSRERLTVDHRRRVEGDRHLE